MRILPISLTEPTLAPIRGLRLGTIRRPAGLLSSCRAGDRLWVREPFHLGAAFDAFSPTAAIARGATPRFAIDGPAEGVGRRRFAREMPRDCHRLHLVLTAVRLEPLPDISEETAMAETRLSRQAFAQAWDEENRPARNITGARVRWADNPKVTVLTFRPVFEPLGNADFAGRERVAA